MLEASYRLIQLFCDDNPANQVRPPGTPRRRVSFFQNINTVYSVD